MFAPISFRHDVDNQRLSKLIFIAAALLVAFAFSLVFLHHHNDPNESENCSICKFVRQIVSFFIFILTVTLFRTPKIRLVPLSSDGPKSVWLVSPRSGRAPPLWPCS